MYSYTHDPESGGIVLNKDPLYFSKEPRPVFADELTLLGFNKIYKYEIQNVTPYMWAESNYYWYRGSKIARISGGDLYNKPEIILEKGIDNALALPEGSTLEAVDIPLMLQKNIDLLKIIERQTQKRIFYYYSKYDKNFDCFRVSFSGGKDSMALLDLLKNSLPKEKLIVLFGDTGMELPDTYIYIEKIKELCRKEKIPFYTAVSHLSALESWEIFGPPSRILRWCCFVHKAAPLALKMREIMGGSQFSELVYVGVRASESESRSHYSFFEKNKKIKGQTTCNAILDWNSAEIWLYTFWKRLPINCAYKYGNQRIGCLFCPMSSKTDYIKYKLYTNNVSKFVNIVKNHFDVKDILNGYWRSRTNGQLLLSNFQKIFEEIGTEYYSLTIYNPKSSFNEWSKTVDLTAVPIHLNYLKNCIEFKIDIDFYKKNRSIVSKIKNIIYKAATCVGCKVCAANCPNGYINFNPTVKISNCERCQSCNQLDYGCLLYNSIRVPQIKDISMQTGAIDRYATHAPKPEWIKSFYKDKMSFIYSNTLGGDQKSRFKAFLRDMLLIKNDQVTRYGDLLIELGLENGLGAQLFLVNLANSKQFKWYIKNLSIDYTYTRGECIEKMQSQGHKEIASKHVISAFKRFCELPFSKILNWGAYSAKGNNLINLSRKKPSSPDARVVLYALYKFAEACGGYYEISLGRLVDFEIESDGVSPAEIFALSRDETGQYLRGLAQNYPDFVINFTSTHGLEILNLNPGKKAEDVLELFA